MFEKIYNFLERAFNDQITWEDYILHIFLFWSNTLLFLVAVLEIFFHDNIFLFHWIHKIEFFFGIIFLTEWVLRLFFTYLPNRVYFNWRLLLQLVVILTLLTPHLFGNLAFLRLMRSFKVLKIYLYKQDHDEMLKEHPEFQKKLDKIKKKLYIKK